MTGTSLLVLIFAAAVFLTLAFVFNRRGTARGAAADPRQGYYGDPGNAMGWAPMGSSGDNGDCSPNDAGCDSGGSDGGGGGGD
jgi:hypothetical protein